MVGYHNFITEPLAFKNNGHTGKYLSIKATEFLNTEVRESVG